MYAINLMRLKTEANWMMEWCFWKNSQHWSSYPSRRKRNDSTVVIRVAHFKSINWFGFNFCKYHAPAVEVMRQLPAPERYFHEYVHDKHTKFRVWCIDGKHFQSVLESLQRLGDIKLEFVIKPNGGDLIVPNPFEPLSLTFYERGCANH